MWSQRGSVLMEFVIVAPLYFLLLGGLFLVGDLILNRSRMHMGDHLATWVGASRFCPRSEGGKDRDAVDGLVQELFGRSVGGVVPHGENGGFDTNWFDVLEDNSAGKVNGFMGLFYGGILNLPVKVPDWVRGMIGLHGLTMGKGSNEIFLMKTADFHCGDYRSYSFHRLPMHGIDDTHIPTGEDEKVSRSKRIAAGDIVLRGQLDNVIRETWISTGVPFKPGNLRPKQPFAKQRYLGRFGE